MFDNLPTTVSPFVEFIRTYAAALPTTVIAIILVIVGLKIGKTVLKVIGFALIVAAILFFVLKV